MKISVCGICFNEEFYAPMFLAACREFADEIVIVDGFSNDGTWEYLEEEAKKDERIKIFRHLGANPKSINFGKARQLAYDNTTGDWVFWLDFDEALQDGARELLDKAMEKEIDVFNVQYVHFIGDFGHIDTSEPIHIGVYRFHRRYPTVRLDYIKNHTLPKSDDFKKIGILLEPIIFHCGYLRGMDKIFKAYYRNVTEGSFHPPYYQAFWKEWHYSGTYPKKKFNMSFIPKVMKEHFHIGRFDLDLKKKYEYIPGGVKMT